uniref:Uncharacterized protein n=1 Tax=Romanomermis culicivorax TaxID=13658 RepID=A0A915I5I2_ROMCU
MQIEELDNQRFNIWDWSQGPEAQAPAWQTQAQENLTRDPAGFNMPNERIPRGNTLNRSPTRVVSVGNVVHLGDGDQQCHAAPDPVIPDQTPARVQPLQQQAMQFTPQDVGVPVVCPPMIAMEPQEAGLANPNPDANGPPQETSKDHHCESN